MLVRRSVALPAVAIVFLSVAPWSWAQQALAADVAGDVRTALSGRWAGVLEYRDYKEPASSLKRVALPTWLQVQTAGTAQHWHYVYDDGPNKVVEEEEQVALDATLGIVTIAEPGEAPQVYKATGFSTLKAGRGTLVLSGTITDNNKPAEARLTLTIGRNIVDLLQEVRPAGMDEAFVFRHEYRFVRTETPVVTAKWSRCHPEAKDPDESCSPTHQESFQPKAPRTRTGSSKTGILRCAQDDGRVAAGVIRNNRQQTKG